VACPWLSSVVVWYGVVMWSVVIIWSVVVMWSVVVLLSVHVMLSGVITWSVFVICCQKPYKQDPLIQADNAGGDQNSLQDFH